MVETFFCGGPCINGYGGGVLGWGLCAADKGAITGRLSFCGGVCAVNGYEGVREGGGFCAANW